jgi:hypothetical protein
MRSLLLAGALCLVPLATYAEETPPLLSLAGESLQPQTPYFLSLRHEPRQGDCPNGQFEVWVNADDQGSIWFVSFDAVWQKPGAEPVIFYTISGGTGIGERGAYEIDRRAPGVSYFRIKKWNGEELLIWNDHVFHSECRPNAVLNLVVPGIRTDLPPHAHLHLTVERASKSCAELAADNGLYIFEERVLFWPCGRLILYWMDQQGIDTTWGRPMLDATRCAARTILVHPDRKESVYSVLQRMFSASCPG